MISKLFVFASKFFQVNLLNEKLLIKSCEGPFGEILTGLEGIVRSVGPERVIVIDVDRPVRLGERFSRYFAALPRHSGYGIDYLAVAPIVVNLVALDDVTSPVEHSNFVAICTICRLK